MMNIGRPAGLLIICAIVLGLGASVPAQVRVGDDGRALDANPRVGSGGYNSPGYIPPVQVSGNQIVTGNVTDGRYFRGEIPYTDPREFRGTTGSGSFDRFIANSASSLPDEGGPLSTLRPRPFYGSRLAAPPPTGYAPLGFTGAYVAVPRVEPQNNLIQAVRSDLLITNPALAPRVGDMVLSAPLDQQTGQGGLMAASPLLGVRWLRLTDPADRTFLSSYAASLRPDDAMTRLRLDSAAIDRMRQELSQSGAADAEGPSRNLARPMPQPFETPENPALSGKPLADDITGRSALGQPAQPSVTWRLAMVPPSQQSAQYAELQRRLNRYYVDKLETDEDRNREFLRQLQAREAADKARKKEPGTSDTPQPQTIAPQPALPDYARISRQLLAIKPAPGQTPKPEAIGPTTRPAPLKIDSLAVGVRAQGLANLLRQAETLMREGKYLAAVDQYEAAEQVAPNNGLVVLGKAHAHLAAAYYKKAEIGLRQALSADPVLMMAQFDLKAMIGQPRLEFLVKDLKDLARRQENDAGPAFLLAYLAYHTGNEQQAATYLDLALARSGGKDELCKLLKVHWALP